MLCINFQCICYEFGIIFIDLLVYGATFWSIFWFLRLFGAPLGAKVGLGTTLGVIWEGFGEDLGVLDARAGFGDWLKIPQMTPAAREY